MHTKHFLLLLFLYILFGFINENRMIVALPVFAIGDEFSGSPAYGGNIGFIWGGGIGDYTATVVADLGVDWEGPYDYYVGGEYISEENFWLLLAEFVDNEVTPIFENPTEKFIDFLISKNDQIDLPGYESTIPEFPKEPLPPSLPVSEKTQAQTQTQSTAVEKPIDQTSAGAGGQPQFVGENPVVAAEALLVGILAGGDTNQSGVVFLDDPVANSGTIYFPRDEVGGWIDTPKYFLSLRRTTQWYLQ